MITEKEIKWIKKLIEDDQLDKFYNDRKWRKLSKEAKRRDKNECQHCKAKGLYAEAEQTHHIKELKDYPHLAYDLFNLISLCKKCHNIVHGKGTNMIPKKEHEVFYNPERW